MLLFPTARFRKRYGKSRRRGTPPPVALTLVSASYTSTGPQVTLTFDRAINIDELGPSQLLVSDAADTGFDLVGSSILSQPDAQSVSIGLTSIGPAEGPTRLNATDNTRIAAVNDGGTWAGVTDLPLHSHERDHSDNFAACGAVRCHDPRGDARGSAVHGWLAEAAS